MSDRPDADPAVKALAVLFHSDQDTAGYFSNGCGAIRRKTYVDHEEARQDVLDYIEMFYNPKRRHSFNNGLSPVECEKQYFERLKSV